MKRYSLQKHVHQEVNFLPIAVLRLHAVETYENVTSHRYHDGFILKVMQKKRIKNGLCTSGSSIRQSVEEYMQWIMIQPMFHLHKSLCNQISHEKFCDSWTTYLVSLGYQFKIATPSHPNLYELVWLGTELKKERNTFETCGLK